MKKLVSVGLFLIVGAKAFSQSMGVVGEVFPVAEMSFLQFIEERLKTLSENGEIDAISERWKHQVEAHTNRPTPLHLPRAIIKRTDLFRPEMVVDVDIKDSHGQVIYPVGTKINALVKLPDYKPCWLFLNADEKAEMRWALKTMNVCPNSKIILTGGAIHEAEVFLNKTIYFDQGGVITKKLKIQATPAYVTREYDALQIEEIVIRENGDVL